MSRVMSCNIYTYMESCILCTIKQLCSVLYIRIVTSDDLFIVAYNIFVFFVIFGSV